MFEDKKVRTLWDEVKEKWYLSITDIIAILTESIDPLAYWRKLKQRLKEEGNETVTNCHALKMQAADGKMRMTDVADTEQLFRLIQSIPSPKAEPFKLWLVQVATEIPKEIFIRCKDDLGIFILFQRINKFRTFTSLENILKLNELVPTL
ncbi:MAG: Bro-N domain-containing protein [Saprospiraceae bacterium]